MTDLIFENVRLLDPAAGLDIVGALLVRDGRVADLGHGLGRPDGARVIDGDGAILCPGLVDMRVEVGEPGGEYRETIASAAVAAAAGGITTLAALPDTKPAIDDPALVRHLRARGEETGSLTILPYAAATKGCRGEELAEAYANMDVFTFPSRTDTFGNVVLEAFASQVPAVVTDAGGPKFIVNPGVSGFVAHSAGEFISLTARLLNEASTRRRMAEAARLQATGESWDAVFNKVYDGYRVALGW